MTQNQKDVQNGFNEILKLKKKLKEVNKFFKDQLMQIDDYVTAVQQSQEANKVKKINILKIKNTYIDQANELDNLKQQISDAKEVSALQVAHSLVAGEQLQLFDNDDKYYPVLTCNFIKE